MAPPSRKASDQFYGLLLRLYPPGFRHHFGPEMAQLLREIYPAGGGKKELGKSLVFWFWMLNDFARSLALEWGKAFLCSEKFKLTEGWTDSLVVPAWITAILFAQAYTLADLMQFLQNVMWAANGSSTPRLTDASLVLVAAVITCGLGVTGALAAWAMARGRCMPDSILNLQP